MKKKKSPPPVERIKGDKLDSTFGESIKKKDLLSEGEEKRSPLEKTRILACTEGRRSTKSDRTQKRREERPRGGVAAPDQPPKGNVRC